MSNISENIRQIVKEEVDKKTRKIVKMVLDDREDHLIKHFHEFCKFEAELHSRTVEAIRARIKTLLN